MCQSHSSRVCLATRSDRLIDADALVTTDTHLALCVKTADCLPILMYDSAHHVVAAIHAGWKGITNQIIENTIDEMVKHGAMTADLHAQIGPHIGSCCYEIHGPRAEHFEKSFANHPEIFHHRNSRAYLDLARCAQIQLMQRGIQPKHIALSSVCTSCSPDQHPSYHRDQSYTDTMISTIWIDDKKSPVRVS
ncbi:MAG: peptidoglycan editing factor PgeF [Candidatus Roizmanbacteria bacterium]